MDVGLVDLPRAVVTVSYNHKDITIKLDQYFLSLKYVDHLNGESDELDLTLADPDDRWINDWYPGKGDKIAATITYKGKTLDCGIFDIDEITVAGNSPRNITLKGLATGVNSPLRTKQNRAHEATTLAAIAAYYARLHGLQLVGQIADIPVDRATQYHESDLRFLKRIGAEHGYLFSIKKGQLIFSDLSKVRSLAASMTLTPSDCTPTITDKIKGIYQAAELQSHDATKRKTVHARHTASAASQPHNTSSDVLRHHRRAHTPATAKIKSQAALDKANLEKTTGSLDFNEGRTDVRSGVAANLIGIGVLSGIYQYQTASHGVDRSGGYTLDAEIQRIDQLPVLSRSQKKATKSTAKSKPKANVVQSVTGSVNHA